MKLLKLLFIGIIGIILLNGCEGGATENSDAPSEKRLKNTPPIPPM